MNVGCGNNKWKGFINVDIDPAMKPDIVSDIRKYRLPIVDRTLDEIWMCHTIEHIQKSYWPSIWFEFSRLLKIGGMLFLTYPEFKICYEEWLKAKGDRKEYLEACIYGRQASSYDFHVAICDTEEICYILKGYGFDDFVCSTELEPQYAALRSTKKKEITTKEDLMNSVVFSRS